MELIYRNIDIEEEKCIDVFSVRKIYIQDVCLLKPRTENCSLHNHCHKRVLHNEMCSEPFLCSGVPPCILTCETNSKDLNKGENAAKCWKNVSVEKFPIQENKIDASTSAESYDNFIETYLHETENTGSDLQAFSAVTDNYQCSPEFHEFEIHSRRRRLRKVRTNLTLKTNSNAQKLDFNDPFCLKLLLEQAELKISKLQERECSQRNHNFTDCNGKCSLQDANSVAIDSSNAFGRVVKLVKTFASPMYHDEYTAETLKSECESSENAKLSNNENKSDVFEEEDIEPRTNEKKCNRFYEPSVKENKFDKSENTEQSANENKFDKYEHTKPSGEKENECDCFDYVQSTTKEKELGEFENIKQSANENKLDSCEKTTTSANGTRCDCCENMKQPIYEKFYKSDENSKQSADENEFDSCKSITKLGRNGKKIDYWENNKSPTNQKKFDKSDNSKHTANENDFDNCENTSPTNEKKFDCSDYTRLPTDKNNFDSSENNKPRTKKKKYKKISKKSNVEKNAKKSKKLSRHRLKRINCCLNPSNTIKKETDFADKGSTLMKESYAKGNDETHESLRITGVKEEINPSSASVEISDESSGQNDSCRKLKVCAFCKKEEIRRKMFKRCSRCRDEHFPEQHYYCSPECLMNDWFESHAKEHFKLKKKKTFSQLKEPMSKMCME